MTKQKIATKDEEFTWKFRIIDISPVFKEVNSGMFKKIAEPNIYTCEEKHNDLADKYISEGLIQLYTKEEEPLRTPEKRYEIEDGRFVCYENKLQGDGNWKEYMRTITDNFYIVLEEDIEFDDGVRKTHLYRGRVIVDNGANEFEFEIDGKLFSSNQEMGKILPDIGGAKIVFGDNAKEVRAAMQTTSKFESRKVSQVFGWQNKKVYQSQSAMIFSSGVKVGDSNVNLSTIPFARNLDILAINNEEFKKVGKHIINDLLAVHERYPIDCLFGFTFLAPIASQIADSDDWDGGKIGMWLVGSSGCGKSYTALLFQNFFGNFKGKNPVFSWLGTPLSIQLGGYYFRDALFMVDDFKIAHFSPSGLDMAVMVLQNYTDMTSRTRLNTGMELNEGKPIQGSMLITGEDVIEDVTSVMARYHVVKMSKEYINRTAGKATKKYKKFYSGFMGRYISWIMKDPKRVGKIVNRIEKAKEEFVGDKDSANIDRVAQSFAYNLVGFDTFCRFLEENKFISMEKHIEMVKTHKNNLFFHIERNVADVRSATVGEVFISTLRDLINSGVVRIHIVDKDKQKPNSYGKGNEFIGFDDMDGHIYLFGVEALGAVNTALKSSTGKGLMNTKQNLTGELIRMGVMIPHIKKDGTIGSNTVNKSYYGNTAVTWKILKYALEGDKMSDVEIDDDIENW